MVEPPLTTEQTLTARLRADLSAAMKSRDELARSTLRMALAAIQVESVAGDTARELSDDEVLAVLRREAKKRREAAEAFDGAGRPESAARERAEGELLATYLPQQLGDDELIELVRAGIAESGAQGMRDMGKAMKTVQTLVAGRAEGGRVAAEVRKQLP
ncbi:MAG: GatB/YqeY domain-containing protein [Geodermatophilaceae bacterium]|nr:GatB/YqeY domain-containing protein [Geodermatophilaceae bacterium]MDQ3456510.1 GatB/YqeY domain-containing protein [Actinomycetota bacterium]